MKETQDKVIVAQQESQDKQNPVENQTIDEKLTEALEQIDKKISLVDQIPDLAIKFQQISDQLQEAEEQRAKNATEIESLSFKILQVNENAWDEMGRITQMQENFITKDWLERHFDKFKARLASVEQFKSNQIDQKQQLAEL